LLSRREQACRGGHQSERNLDWSIHTVAPNELEPGGQQPRPFLDRSLDEFRVATKFGPDHDELDGCDQRARAQSNEFAESGHPFAVRQQRFLPAQNALKWKCSSGRKSALISWEITRNNEPTHQSSHQVLRPGRRRLLRNKRTASGIARAQVPLVQ